MAFPSGVEIVTVVCSPPISWTGTAATLEAKITATHSLIHAASGTPVVAFTELRSGDPLTPVSVGLPTTDQSGFRDSSGADFTNWAYIIRGRWMLDGEQVSFVKSFQIPTGTVGPVDLDLLPDGPISTPVTAPTPAVLGFEGRTGFVTLEESDLPARLDPAALNATILTEVAAPISAAVAPKANTADVYDKTTSDATYQDKATALRVSDLFLSLGKYGVPSANNTAIIAQAFTDAETAVSASGPRGHDGTYGPAARAVYFPAGVWTTTAAPVVPRGVSVILPGGAVLRATAAITGPLLDTSSMAWEGQIIGGGGTLDCNLLAQDGLRIRVGRYSSIRDLHIDDPTRHGVILGDTGLSASSFEMHLSNVMVRRRTGLPLVSGARGFSIDKCSDSVFFECVAVSFETGFYEASGDNRKIGCHAWGFPGSEPHYAFDDTTGSHSHYIGCIADSPSVAGFRIRLGFASITESSVFLGSSQVDNTVVGVKFDAGATNFTAANNRFQGASGSVRLAADYQGADDVWKATSTITGQTTAFTVTPMPTRNTFPPYSTAGQLAERSLYIPGTVAVSDLPPSIFWSVPVQADSVVIRSNSGSGTQFQIWQGGTQLTPTFNLGDVAILNSPFGSGTATKLAAYAGLYIKVVTAGTGNNFTAVFKAYQNG